MTPVRLVEVAWDDAILHDGVGPTEDDGTPYRVITVGWLVGESARAVLVAAERLPDGRYRGVTRIPRAIILSVRALERGAVQKLRDYAKHAAHRPQ